MSTSLRAALLFSLNIFLWVTYSKESLIQEGLNRYKFASLICNCKEITASPNWKRLLLELRLLMKWTRYVNHSITEKNVIKNFHNADILYFKTALCKSICTVSKICIKWKRATRNRISQGISVYFLTLKLLFWWNGTASLVIGAWSKIHNKISTKKWTITFCSYATNFASFIKFWSAHYVPWTIWHRFMDYRSFNVLLT